MLATIYRVLIRCQELFLRASCINSFNPENNTVRKMYYYYPLYIDKETSIERLSNFPKVTKFGSA